MVVQPLTDDDNVVSMDEWKRQPRPMRGGVGPPMKPGTDYLSDMKSGTEFLVRDKTGITPRWLVVEWVNGGLHSTGNVLLIPTKSANDVRTWIWVDPIEFCKAFEFRGIIEENDGSDIDTGPDDMEGDKSG